MDSKQIESLTDFIKNPYPVIEELSRVGSEGANEIKNLMEIIEKSDINNFVKIDISTIRGLDYYTGTVFEIFDLNPENSRAIAGGGRYDDLISLFGDEKLTGTGFAMGDITLVDFLKTWGLLPKFDENAGYFITLWPSEDQKYFDKTLEVSNILRKKGFEVSTWLEKNTKIEKQLKYADKKGFEFVVIIGENEREKGTVIVKNMKEKTQKEVKFSDL